MSPSTPNRLFSNKVSGLEVDHRHIDRTVEVRSREYRRKSARARSVDLGRRAHSPGLRRVGRSRPERLVVGPSGLVIGRQRTNAPQNPSTREMRVMTQKLKTVAAEFLSKQRVAVTGVSRMPKDHGGNVVYRRLRERGYQVFTVNPNAQEVEGDPCYHDLQSIPGSVEWVLIATAPARADETMRQCVDLGIRHVWIHRGPGADSVSEMAAEYGRNHGVKVITALDSVPRPVELPLGRGITFRRCAKPAETSVTTGWATAICLLQLNHAPCVRVRWFMRAFGAWSTGPTTPRPAQCSRCCRC